MRFHHAAIAIASLSSATLASAAPVAIPRIPVIERPAFAFGVTCSAIPNPRLGTERTNIVLTNSGVPVIAAGTPIVVRFGASEEIFTLEAPLRPGESVIVTSPTGRIPTCSAAVLNRSAIQRPEFGGANPGAFRNALRCEVSSTVEIPITSSFLVNTGDTPIPEGTEITLTLHTPGGDSVFLIALTNPLDPGERESTQIEADGLFQRCSAIVR